MRGRRRPIRVVGRSRSANKPVGNQIKYGDDMKADTKYFNRGLWALADEALEGKWN